MAEKMEKVKENLRIEFTKETEERVKLIESQNAKELEKRNSMHESTVEKLKAFNEACEKEAVVVVCRDGQWVGGRRRPGKLQRLRQPTARLQRRGERRERVRVGGREGYRDE